MPHPIVGFDSNEENEKITMKNITSYAIKKKKKNGEVWLRSPKRFRKHICKKLLPLPWQASHGLGNQRTLQVRML